MEFIPQPPTNSIANSKPPAGPPPPFIPSKTQAMYQTFGGGQVFHDCWRFMILDPSVIQTLMFRYVYIWLKNSKDFGHGSIS